MPLEEEFRKKMDSLIDEALIPHGIMCAHLDKDVWNYRYALDFLSGQKAGFVGGLVVGYYISLYGKSPTKEEMDEMTTMIEARADEIKRTVSDLETHI